MVSIFAHVDLHVLTGCMYLHLLVMLLKQNNLHTYSKHMCMHLTYMYIYRIPTAKKA